MTDTQVAIDINLTGPFTLDEIVEIEDIAGTGETIGPHSGRMLRAIALVVGRRSNPTLTMADVGQVSVAFDQEV